MKTLKNFAFLLVAILTTATASAQKSQNDTTVCYKVSMDCMDCKLKIEKNIAFEKGVKMLDISLPDKTVKVKYNKNKNTAENLKMAIEKLKYKVEIIDTTKN